MLQELRERGTTVLMIEQNAKSALEASDYGLVLQQGRLALAGTASDVLNHPEIGRLFLGGAMRLMGSDAMTVPYGPRSARLEAGEHLVQRGR